MWFRRDLRVHDNEALSAACSEKECVALFVLDPIFLERSGLPRLTFLFDALKALNESLGGSLVIRIGNPIEVVPAFAAEVKAQTVFVAKDFAPYGRKRDIEVAAALRSGGMTLRGVGSPYCVEPGTVRKDDGNPYAVFTPFSKRWAGHLRPHEESDAVFSSVVPAGVV
ncbi:MAG: deoxyribodipyrimidine photo-lyase, partial [Actinomycetota bacterium]